MISDFSFQMGLYQFDILQITSSQFEASVPEHSHGLHSYEVHFINSGYGTLIANGAHYELSPGVLYITGPNIPHAQLIADETPMWETSIFYKVTPLSSKYSSNSSCTSQEKRIISSFLSHHFWIGHDMQHLPALLANLLHELNSGKSGSQLMVETYLKQLLILITRNYEDTVKVETYNKTIDLNNQRFLLIDQLFLNNYQTISLESLAKKVGLSTRQTQRLLLEYYGLDFNSKRLQARMAQAKLLLESTDKLINEIAELIGYATTEHFCKVFKKYYQITASEYRKQMGKPPN